MELTRTVQFFFVHIRGCVIKSLHLLCIPHNSQPILGELSGNFE